MSGEQLKQMSQEELYALPVVLDKLTSGEKQVVQYGKILEEKYGNLRLQKFVVVALGFERVCFRKVS